MSANKKTAKSIPSRRPTRVGRNAPAKEKVSASLKRSVPAVKVSRNNVKSIFFVVLALLVIGTGWFYYSKIYLSPKRVFWAMVENNLTTQGVTRETAQATCLPTSRGLAQSNVIELNFSPDTRIHCMTSFEDKPKATIESVGTTTVDYQKYHNLWLMNGAGPASLYTQLLYTPALYANLPSDQRTILVNGLKMSYSTNYAAASKRSVNHRPQLTYSVSVNMRNFAATEQAYADMLHLPESGRLSPERYQRNSKINVIFSVDALSRQLREVKYQGTTHKYSGYGVTHIVNPPSHIATQAEIEKTFKENK